VSERAILALVDGTLWPGRALGARGQTTGEVVFNTSMTGYQEILTDPSYCRQIVVMTAPHIGNTGVNAEDDESERVHVAGFAVRRASPIVSSWRACGSLDHYLRERGIVAIDGLDTRALVRHLRDQGAMHGALASDGLSDEATVQLARDAVDINTLDLVGEVTCRAPYAWVEPAQPAWYPLWAGGDGPSQAGSTNGTATRASTAAPAIRADAPHALVYDFGVKRNTLRLLAARGCRVTVVPARTAAAEALALRPDGILLSNGPGDPARLGDVVAIVRGLVGRVPLFGICLGHQLIGHALGGTTYKLKFGHRGGNQPVRGPRGVVEISSHNHGFAVAAEGLPFGVEVTHVNLNDGCVEGLAWPAKGVFSVQYHPEAAPGPHDADPLFEAFLAAMAPA